MEFEWDTRKAESNKTKHGVSFQEAAMVFADPLSISWPDPDHSVTEHRFITLGMIVSGAVVMVAHTDRGQSIRIISARKATRLERRYYEEGQ